MPPPPVRIRGGGGKKLFHPSPSWPRPAFFRKGRGAILFEIAASIVPPPPLFGHRHSIFLVIKKRRILRFFLVVWRVSRVLYVHLWMVLDSVIMRDWIIIFLFFPTSINKLAINKLDYFGRALRRKIKEGGFFFLFLFYIRSAWSCEGTGFLSTSEWFIAASK